MVGRSAQGVRPPRLDPAKVSVCAPQAADGIAYEYRARTYDEAGNHSPSSESRARAVL
ncbi:hypothetical protein [Streptomyces sp. NPDC056361]|uniref:hypothetical protein n=1 Tax=Streptomyces sp. NPDC056361 TaxID=3345795 RepID=UPI0035D99048